MSFVVSQNALVRFKAQTNLNVIFTQILRNGVTGESVKATLQTELCQGQVRVELAPP